jgi:phosphoribosylglycinamide formyltransferase-1
MRVVVLASGTGSNAEALIKAASDWPLGLQVAAVVSNQPGAGVIAKATQHNVDSVVLEKNLGEARAAYDARLSQVVRSHQPDLVVLAGWMRILTESFIASCGAPIINLHPALPGELPGTNAIERAFAERESGRTISGVMVHLVPDEGVDTGPVLGSVDVELCGSDSLEQFAQRMHRAEHELIVRIVRQIAEGIIIVQQEATQ